MGLDDMQDQLRSMHTFQEQRAASLSRNLVNDFMEAFKFPQRVRSLYYKQQEGGAGLDREAVFNRVFPGLPFYVAIAPLPKSKELTSIHNLEGKKGGELARLFKSTIQRTFNAAAERSVLMLFQVPFMDGGYCMHAIDERYINPLDFPGAFYSLKSETGSRVFIHAMVNFAAHPVVNEMVRGSIEKL